jgi:alkylation response protein AidB-like acyl-CoA dehydrogenase
MAIKISAARELVYAAARKVAVGEYPVREITIAKVNAVRTNVEIADTCIQIHGGAGYMKEYHVERMWRDARLARIGAGTDEILLDVIGKTYGI